MNTLIQHINTGGGRLLNFVGPLAWQSGLLILLLFAADLLLRRRVAASVRYGLWLLLAVKLMLPPSLALPGSLGWWMGAIRAAISHSPVPAPPPRMLPASLDDLSDDLYALRASLSASGWMLVAWAVVGLVLLTFLVLNWRRVARCVREGSVPPAWLEAEFEHARLVVGVGRSVRLRLTEAPLSPSVAGLSRPVVLLPRALGETLGREQLRAVLLHELIHIRRLDVWVNCAQTILQVIYWWHPLVWVANSRIRRLREEAVDDAVVLALGEDADCYAPTLVEVAKMAFHRPLAALGLVGMLESRGALRRRIERLVEFCPGRAGKLTLASCVGIVMFGAVALPMSSAPVAPASAEVPAQALPSSPPQPGAAVAPAQALPVAPSEVAQLSPAPAGTPTNAPGPAIRFAMTFHDFGKVDSGVPVKCAFNLTNVGTQTLELSDVKPTCGCTTAKEWPHRLEPGESGVIRVEINTENLSGSVTKIVNVTCNDPNHHTVALQLKGTVWKAIEVMPPLAFLKVPDESPSNGVAVVRLISHLETPLTLGAPVCDNPAFRAEIATDKPGKDFRLIVRATTAMESLSATAKIRMKTSAPNTPELIIPVLANRAKTVAVSPAGQSEPLRVGKQP